ncbi:MAG: MarR family winged helix-turn-helix transcriptional regulator [Chordicoccus sp.]
MQRTNDIGRLIKAVDAKREAHENRVYRPFGLTAMQMQVLIFLDDCEGHMAPLKALEKEFCVTQSTMAKLIKNLENEKHLVEYVADDRDRRVKKIRLTPEAEPICQKAEPLVDETEKTLTACLTEEETEQLRSLLRRMYEALR